MIDPSSFRVAGDETALSLVTRRIRLGSDSDEEESDSITRLRNGRGGLGDARSAGGGLGDLGAGVWDRDGKVVDSPITWAWGGLLVKLGGEL